MTRQILYHTLRNFKEGWPSFFINPLDVSMIRKFGYCNRPNAIFEPTYEWMVWIEYYSPHSAGNWKLKTFPDALPGFSSMLGPFVGFTWEDKKIAIQTMEALYKTKDEACNEIRAIQKSKRILREIESGRYSTEQLKKFMEDNGF